MKFLRSGKEVRKVMRNFLWEGTEERRKEKGALIGGGAVFVGGLISVDSLSTNLSLLLMQKPEDIPPKKERTLREQEMQYPPPNNISTFSLPQQQSFLNVGCRRNRKNNRIDKDHNPKTFGAQLRKHIDAT
ncbi:Mob1/phocein family protein [Prunus dulcis]|uniref:Mob1/phocein family protein n=1 Tax=Prunus dulcis TaxID=3755 RepID=A0A4Y1RFB0_PRUDU|nr:Mob1/phocein family protein [Prunus dulcis]